MTEPIKRLLVANRGEIARRVFATCRRLGIGTVAVHSDPDAGLSFVREADVAVRLPGSTPSETYLRGDLVVAAALAAGADAVHPGYGFLSENAGFARRVLAAGLSWVGPTPESMEQMASKVEAKKLMAAAGVPVLPELSPADVTESDLPLLVKASAGGGGRGMRVVRTLAEVPGAVEQASAEAASAFDDPTVFCEPYVERGRHVEVQLLGDTHGTVLVVGDRDCSVQRRHQKVVEEAPAPGLSDDVRAAVHDAARTAGEAIGYVGAGTVDFLLEGGRFFFLEMNTRLQVEHPVTELTTYLAGCGLDLVEQQLLLAEGSLAPAFSRRVEEAVTPRHQGHAVEVRLYAEDPARDAQPQSGRLTRFEVDHDVAFGPLTGPGLRLDAGVRAGDEVGTHYDAMLAKLVSWAPTRAGACRRLAAALERAEIHGVLTNRDLLVEVLRSEAFLAGELSTDFLSHHLPHAFEDHTPPVDATPGPGVLRGGGGVCRDLRGSSAGAEGGPDGLAQRGLGATGHELRPRRHARPGRLAGRPGRVPLRGPAGEVHGARTETVEPMPGCVRVIVAHGTLRHPFDVYVVGDQVDVESAYGHLALSVVPRFTDPAARVASGSLLAPMPGSVLRVHVEPGQQVTAGDPVLVLEAMKMQHTVSAPHDGEVGEVLVGVGSHVAAGEVLAVVSTGSTPRTTDQQGEADD